MVEANKTVKLELKDDEVRALLLLIRKRQDDCQLVDETYPTFQKYWDLEIQLERLKMKIAGQL